MAGENREMTQQEFNKALVEGMKQEFASSQRERQAMANQLAEMKQQIEEQQAQPPAPSPEQADQMKTQVGEYMNKSPVDYTRDLVGAATAQSVEAMKKVLEERDAEKFRIEQNGSFWRDVWQANPDVADLQHQIVGLYNTTDPSLDASDRVNWAISEVRKQVQARVEWNKQQEAQNERQKQMMGSAANNTPFGRMMLAAMQPGQVAGPAGDPSWQEVYDPKTELDSFVKEQNARLTQKTHAASRVSMRPEERLTQ